MIAHFTYLLTEVSAMIYIFEPPLRWQVSREITNYGHLLLFRYMQARRALPNWSPNAFYRVTNMYLRYRTDTRDLDVVVC